MAVFLPLAVSVSFLGENALRIPDTLKVRADPASAATVARVTGSVWEAVEILGQDNAPLRAWLFQPRHAATDAVIVLHGVADSRRGALGHARLLLSENFAVLTPDSRSHGESGGDLVTYGVREADDVRRWAEWLRRRGMRRVYGLGESMGAAILLQSLALSPPFRAVVAECSFSDFPGIAYDRVANSVGLPFPSAPALLWPAIEPGLLYARLRYGVDLGRASPRQALAATDVPVLLIHGLEDRNIFPAHARRLRAAARGTVELWEVPGAGHTGALGSAPEEFARRVVGWFRNHK